MKVKTAELEGPALDWAVAEAAGYKPRVYSTLSIRAELPTGGVIAPFMPGFRWDQGGPILDREGIGVKPLHKNVWAAFKTTPYGPHLSRTLLLTAETYLTAGMRCFVTSRLGDEIEVPDELMTCSNRDADASEDQAAAHRPRSR